MVYDGATHQSLAASAELAARSVVIGSFGKTFHATGWKVGYALAVPEEYGGGRRPLIDSLIVIEELAKASALAGWPGRCPAMVS